MSSKDRRLGDGKIEIGESNSGDARHRAGSALGDGFCVGGCELLEATRHDLLDDLLLIAEMLVRRGGRDARAAAGVSQREAVGTVLDQKVARGRNQRFAKISMVEPLLRAHRCSFLCLGHEFPSCGLCLTSQ